MSEINKMELVEKTVEVPEWVLSRIKNVLRLTHNRIVETGECSSYSRQVLTAELQLAKIMNGEEVTGDEYLEAMKGSHTED